MPLMLNELPPVGNEVIFKRDSDGVFFAGVRAEDGTYTMSLPDADTTFDPATVSEWYRPE
jgi:hypothetical protein